jgi:hypothetical protein
MQRPDLAVIEDILAQPEPTPARSPKPLNGGSNDYGRYSEYNKTALKSQTAIMADALQGERNITLNRCAYALGRLEHIGMGKDDAETELVFAAVAVGLKEFEARTAFRSGWEAGRREPYTPEDREPVTQRKTSQPEAQREKKLVIATRLGELLQEPSPDVDYVVDNLLAKSGTSLVIAKPKVGKTTLVRFLCLCVAMGWDFLERKTQQGAVLYIALEDRREDVKRHFRDMGAPENAPVFIVTETMLEKPFDTMRELINTHKPPLMVIDTLFRLAKIKDGNSYSEVTAALTPLIQIAHETGTHVLCVHHAGKGEREGGDMVLGSQAIFGSVDTGIFLRRQKDQRTIHSIQRIGTDMLESVLDFDPDKRTVALGASREAAERMAVAKAILGYLQERTDATEKEIEHAVEGRTTVKRFALRELLKGGAIVSTGEGKRGSAFRYSVLGTETKR